MTRAALVLIVLACGACGGRAPQGTAPATRALPATTAERMIALFPEGAQVLVELDLARLRANEVVGPVATHALAELGAETRVPGLPVTVQGSPLASADLLVLGAYGVGTAGAASIVVLATKQEVEGATRLTPEFVALGPPEWVRQLEARAAIAERAPLAPSLALMSLRDHAMPENAPGAVLRVTAQLPFDARVALAQQVGLDTPPAQVSIWADVVDDLAVIVDVDATDPGDKPKDSANRLAKAMTAMLAAMAREPALVPLGMASALRDARLVTDKTWVRAIIVVGPRQLKRATERARAMLGPAS